MLIPLLISLTLHLPADAPAPAPRIAPPTDAGFERREVARIRRHFDGALDLLAARDLSTLTPAQRAGRAALATRLRAYRDQGVFPHNYDFPGEAVPYFVDRRTGTRCAVAHLMESTGRGDMVARVAAMDNNIRVMELAGDAEFRAWLEENGLTIEEAARIQVPYIGPMPVDPIARPLTQLEVPDRLNSNTTLLAVGASLGVATIARFGGPATRTRTTALAGAAAATFSFIQAGRHFSGSGPQRSAGLGTVALLGGGLSLFTASRTLSRLRADERAGAPRRISVAPILPASRTQGAGLAFSMAF